MFKNYTAKAMRVILFARVEASEHGATAIETEHLLLGLLRADMDLINRFYFPKTIRSLFELLEVHTKVKEKIPTSIELPLSAESTNVLQYAVEEARQLTSKQVGSEHILLGLLREEECLASRVLRECGLDPSLIRKNLINDTAAA